MNRQRLILFILVILLGIATLWSYSAMPRFKTVGTAVSKPDRPKPTAATTAAIPAGAADDGTRLNIRLLDKEPGSFTGYRRNLFKPVFVDEMKIARQKAVASKPIVKVPATPVLPVITQPETAPLARFTYLGYLKKGAVKTIFLANGKDILLVKKGDKVADRYEAADISDQALTLTVIDTGDVIVIPLLENRPLSMTK